MITESRLRRFTQGNILGPAFDRREPIVKVYGFPYLDYFQQRRGKVWHTVRQILDQKDGTQCERLVQANTGGYRILRVIVLCKTDEHFAFRYKVVCS